jgi:hypothetical protein
MRSSQCRGPSKRIRKRKTERRNAVRERRGEGMVDIEPVVVLNAPGNTKKSHPIQFHK